MSKASSGALIVLLTLATFGTAKAQIVPGPQGPVEFIGLDHWKAAAVFDTIRVLTPDRPFHACAVVMRNELGFADAAAMGFFTATAGEIHTVVVGIEDSAGVQYRETGKASVRIPAPLAALVQRGEAGIGHITGPARSLHLVSENLDSARSMAERWGAAQESVESDWIALRAANDPSLLVAIRAVVAEDSSWLKRSAAVAALANFPEHPSAWRVLIEAFRDQDARVTTTAQGVAEAFLEGESVVVEWADSEASISAVFGGTNPFAFALTLRMLTATKIDEGLGSRIARTYPRLLLGYARAQQPDLRSAAHTFLRHVSGLDHSDPQEWARWLVAAGSGS
jgi:hypothetical protein